MRARTPAGTQACHATVSRTCWNVLLLCTWPASERPPGLCCCLLPPAPLQSAPPAGSAGNSCSSSSHPLVRLPFTAVVTQQPMHAI